MSMMPFDEDEIAAWARQHVTGGGAAPAPTVDTSLNFDVPLTPAAPAQAAPVGAFPPAEAVFGPQRKAIDDYVAGQADVWKQLEALQKQYAEKTKPSMWDSIEDGFYKWAALRSAAQANMLASTGGVLTGQLPDANPFVSALNANRNADLHARHQRNAAARTNLDMQSQVLLGKQQQALQNLGLSRDLANAQLQYGLNTGKMALELAKFGQDQIKAVSDYIEKAVPNPETRAQIMSVFVQSARPGDPLPVNLQKATQIVTRAQEQGLSLADRDAWTTKTLPNGQTVQVNTRTGKQEALPGGDGDKKQFEMQKDLRDEYIKQSKPFIDLRTNYGRIEAASKDNTGASDIALVYAFMKMLDPTSVVREGEFATAQNAGGVPDRVIALYNRTVNGTRLPENVRHDFVQQAQRQLTEATKQHEANTRTYHRLAKRYGFDPEAITIDLSGGVSPVTAEARAGELPRIMNTVEGQQTYNKLPSGARFIDPNGVERVKP